jgi:hypothetical protein
MKFTTLIPTTWNDGTPIDAGLLTRMIDSLWRPFGGMTKQESISGHWVDDDGTEFADICIQISIECERGHLTDAIKRVRRIGKRLEQRAMYFEVSGYDGVQFLRIA